jgi:hypothetical protein
MGDRIDGAVPYRLFQRAVAPVQPPVGALKFVRDESIIIWILRAYGLVAYVNSFIPCHSRLPPTRGDAVQDLAAALASCGVLAGTA